MKKIITYCLFVFALSSSAFAQPAGMGKNDPNAKVILDAVSAKFKTYKAVEAKFNLKIENATGKILGSKSGTVYMKGTKYKIDVTGQEIYCDGGTIYTYEKGANELTITKVDLSANSITPQKIFTNFYDKDFLYKLNGDVKINGKNASEIELTPIDKSRPFFKVLVYVDKATTTIVSTKVFEKAGNKYTYGVSKMNTKAVVTDAQFVFDAKKYPGVDITDLR
jgi:outer membrane lipoprotein-sorting protein